MANPISQVDAICAKEENFTERILLCCHGKWKLAALLVLLVVAVFLVWNPLRTYRVDKVIKKYAGEYGVDYKFARDIARAESSLNPQAVSKDGGVGLYQFMPKTWEWATENVYGNPLGFWQAKDLKTNAEVGIWFINWIERTLKKRNAYSEAAVIYCFNYGIGKFENRKKRIPRKHRNKIYDRYFKAHHKNILKS